MEQFLLWELPLKRGNQYFHADLLKEGVKTVAPIEATLAKGEEMLKRLQEKMKT